MKNKLTETRREFIRKSSLATVAAIAVPTIVPASVFGKNAPSNRINVGMIGTGRQAISVNLKNGFLKLDNCRVTAVCDADSWRMNLAKDLVNKSYGTSNGVKEYKDYRDLVNDNDVDAVMISSADHWHAPHTIAAALAGKHVCMEKAFTIAAMHGKAVVGAVEKMNVTGRLDSEFRSLPAFHRAVELVHNKVIGEITEVQVGVPSELSGEAMGPQPTMPVPEDLDYDRWLGPAFPAPYTFHRVHEPRVINSRPGWLRIKDYCNGMITNWGAHLNDIALWGIKKEYELPGTVEGSGVFDRGLWNTLNSFDLHYEYADGLVLNYKIDAPYVKFIGKDGWIKVEYPDKLTASSDKILAFEPGKKDISYEGTLTDKADFLRGIKTGEPTMEPLQVGYNVYFLTMMGLISIELGNKLTWDAKKESFVDNNAANALLTSPFREKWIDSHVVAWMNQYQSVNFK
jgi:myo-inositol 2-dehydrogenase/D-chiro-inositol 1-dehydrogenase